MSSFQHCRIGSRTLTFLTAFYILALGNFTFWQKLHAVFAGQQIELAIVAVVLLLLHFAVLLIFSAPYMLKPVFAFTVLCASAAAYFSDNFGTVIDRGMIRNIVDTTPTEAGHLMSPQFLLHFAATGILPALLIAVARVDYGPLRRQIAINTPVIIGCFVLAGGLIASDLSTYIPFWQTQRERAMAYLNPFTGIYSAAHFAILQVRDVNIVARPYGEDASQGSRVANAKKPLLTVIVVGETARAQDFSLDGYDRDTNPELEARDVVSMTKATSCGTATAVSVPCMFSHLGHDSFSNRAALGTENLLDVLTHAGLTVRWWENDTGDKRVADRVPMYDFSRHMVDGLCRNSECDDQVLVDRLKEKIGAIDKNAVLVLHTMGSHGPAYYQRYPEAFRKFKPDCRDAELSNCSGRALVNAYDNTILYTDHILAEIIDTLKANGDRLATSMIYISDHGESLGEAGLYLHGAPYAFAPSTQTHVPFIFWASDAFARTTRLNMACLRRQADTPVSHDNLFDTVLGLMDVETNVYRRGLDAFAACRGSDTVGEAPNRPSLPATPAAATHHQ